MELVEAVKVENTFDNIKMEEWLKRSWIELNNDQLKIQTI